MEMLGIMEANIALMNLENVRILKEMRGSVNRKVNCETANINKTVSAAIRQIEDIRYIEETTGFSSLPEPLEQMARLRLQYPEASLLELGKMLTPVVGKSGVNHRLRKLKEIAEDLRRREWQKKSKCEEHYGYDDTWSGQWRGSYRDRKRKRRE